MTSNARLSVFAAVLLGTLVILPPGGAGVGACHPENLCVCDDIFEQCWGDCYENNGAPYPDLQTCLDNCDAWTQYCIDHACGGPC